jgi:thiol-disulfide isomerase/thioredoxin
LILIRSILIPAVLITQTLASGGVIEDVRSSITQKDFTQAERRIAEYRKQLGVTPELLAALSWMSRGALAEKQLDRAESYAQETHHLALAQLQGRKLDDDKLLPLALGAAIEVQAQVLAARGERAGAVDFLKKELATHRATSIRTRIQKNLHMLSLEGKPAPKLEGAQLPAGKPALLFFWAHWCPDCKIMAPALARLKKEYAAKGFAIIAPTQRYGYTRRGQDASPAVEDEYIAAVRKEQYAGLLDVPAPVNEENFRAYGASTTPTLVLIDAKGIVRMYHPGEMTYAELEPRVRQLFR